MQGRQDPLGDSIPLGLAAYYPDSKLVFIEKAGHYSWIEQAEAVRAAVCDFMSKLEN